MKRTRNLFILVGTPTELSIVLGTLNFKGLISNDYGMSITQEQISEAFAKNKSVACAANDYPGEIPKDAIIINVVRSTGAICRLNAPIILVDLPDVASQFARIADKLGYDIGDHKSNSSGLNGTPTIKDCVYCRYLAGDVGINERTIYRSKNFFVIPATGQFVKGYLLIMPIAHIMSNAELDEASLTEFKEVLSDVEEILRLTYGKDVLIWENGSGHSGIGKAKDSIVHSHVHIAPSNLTTDDIANVSGYPFTEIRLEDLQLYNQNSYLLVRTPDKEHWIINDDPALYIPRQYVRQILAEEYGVLGDMWNWRTYPFVDKLHQTVVDIQQCLSKNWENLPTRIKENTSCLFE